MPAGRRERPGARPLGTSASVAILGSHNAILGTLREGSFSIELTHHAFHVLDIYVYGFPLGTVTFPIADEELPSVAREFVQQLPSNRYPYLVEHITYHVDSGLLSEGDFQFGLDLLLDSLERVRDGPPQ